MISEEAPGPLMISEPALDAAAIAGKDAPRVIVLTPLKNIEEAKIISSLAAVALASAMASLKERKASVESTESAVVVTV